MENNNEINRLLQRITELQSRQNHFQREISQLRSEVRKLADGTSTATNQRDRVTEDDLFTPEFVQKTQVIEETFDDPIREKTTSFSIPPPPKKKEQSEKNTALKEGIEAFIGTNLINKIGILITIIGVGIGTKYAIDNELINPLTRIVLSYVFGTGLLLIAFRLKKKYENYSAVLLSGALAIMYFTTYIAYDFYSLFPQLIAFALMLVFTAFSVASALSYNKQVIAAIGLVGAYGIPFLLSEGNGKVEVLFTYMAIVNIGILLISFFKYWKYVFYLAFAFTWLIFLTWFNTQYEFEKHFEISLIFSSIFFLIFYTAFVAYKILKKEIFETQDVILILSNSFIAYGLGYAALFNNEATEVYLGFFTVGNAITHFIVSAMIYRQKLADKNLFFLTAGLVLLFITIAVPVQLDGSWVTLIWGGEALILFWIGSSQNIKIYEKLSYPLILTAFFSMIHDWSVVSNYQYTIEKIPNAFLNINFLTAIILSVVFGVIVWLYNSQSKERKNTLSIVGYGISIVFLSTLFYTFFFEIELYWQNLYQGSSIEVMQNGFETELKDQSLYRYSSIWLINYTLFFFAALSFINLYKIKSKALANVTSILNVFTILISLFFGLLICSQLRESYINQTDAEYFVRDSMHILIRYVLSAFVILNLVSLWLPFKSSLTDKNLKTGFEVFCHFTILFLASSELLHWMDLAESAQSYKLGLSILWGVYSLFMVVLGIRNKQKPIRVAGIFLFGITLLKLFFYDIANLNTLAKVIVFISLGILLLIISFLYNKYKDVIAED